MPLDNAQYKAVNHREGPAMILAGPGSGKTTVITHRIKMLIENCSVKPEQILVITFTRMAASEMKQRFLNMLPSGEGVVFGTFHAVFFMILRIVYKFRAENIIKLNEQRAFVKAELLANGVVSEDENTLIMDVISEIARVKAGSYNIEEYYSFSCAADIFRRIFIEYNRYLEDNHKLDFEDMMLKTYELLIHKKDILRLWQEKFKYVMVDEFQDSSPIQFEVIKLLCQEHRNIFVVGDDDQSIYGFRGAAPKIMRDFTHYYKNAVIYNLNINYRSDKYIVSGATRVINSNDDRFYKDLKAFNRGDNKVEVVTFNNISQEADYVNNYITKHCLGRDETVAVLTRLNNGAVQLQNILKSKNIAYSCKGKNESIFTHWIALDIIAYIRIALGSGDRGLYLRIINKPQRYISRQFFTDERVNLDYIEDRMRLFNQTELVNALLGLRFHIANMSKMDTYAGIMYIRKVIGYEEWLLQYSNDAGIAYEQLKKILDDISESARLYNNYKLWVDMVEASVADNSRNDTGSCGISFCTLHSSKGLEFDTVFILDVNEGILPYSKAVTKEAVEEERRLFYVGMTRAKSKLYICYVKERYNKTMQPSRFIKELHGNI